MTDYFKKGYDDARSNREPHKPSTSNPYGLGNALIDVAVPGLGFICSGSDATKKDDADYQEGFVAGSRTK